MQSPKAGRKNGANMGRADWLDRSSMDYILAAMMPANRLVMECCIASGLRVSDVLSLKTDALARGQRITVREQKTGKSRRIYWPSRLYTRMLEQAGRVWVFEGRNNWRKHRTRSAVYKDLCRVARVFRVSGIIDKKVQVSTHTGRKMWAVDEYHRTGDLQSVGRALNHDGRHRETTMLYAMADAITAGKKDREKSGKRGK